MLADSTNTSTTTADRSAPELVIADIAARPATGATAPHETLGDLYEHLLTALVLVRREMSDRNVAVQASIRGPKQRMLDVADEIGRHVTALRRAAAPEDAKSQATIHHLEGRQDGLRQAAAMLP